MLKFYYSGAPNPMKVALFLEELELSYDPIPIDTRKGDQHKPEYLAINPNAKVPAIVDGDATVFESNAILLYLAEKTGKFLPGNTPKARGELFSWLMFVASGVGPFAGQSVHFRHYAPEKIDYATNRYMYEARRHFGILDARLSKRRYMLGDTYTIVGMAVWTFWIGGLVPDPDIGGLYLGSLSARISSLWISGALANRSPALAFSIKAAATWPLRCASGPASSSSVSKMAKVDGPS